MQAFNLIRCVVLQGLDIAQDRQCVIDSLPLPAVQFYLVPGSTADWKAFVAPSARFRPDIKPSLATNCIC